MYGFPVTLNQDLQREEKEVTKGRGKAIMTYIWRVHMVHGEPDDNNKDKM